MGPSTAADGRILRIQERRFGQICPPRADDTDRSGAYVGDMLSTLLIIGGVLVGLIVLLAVIVALSARPKANRGSTSAARTPSWVVHSGRPHPDAWEPLTTTGTTEIRAIR